MKDNILRILKEAQLKSKFDNVEYKLTLNYEDVIPSFSPLKLNKETKQLFEKKFEKFKNINSFNFTIEIARKNEWDDEHGFGKNWKIAKFIFYSGNDENIKEKIDTNKYGRFEFDSTGSRGSIRISEKLSKNIFEYDKIGKTIDYLLQLDKLLDKQFDEKSIIFDKLQKTK